MTQYVKKRLNFLFCLIPVALFIQCTAYFNTYYNGETAFREAQVAHQKIMRNYPDSIVVAPTNEISIKYERAIEKSIKVIETYNKKKKWHDDALFLMGKSYFYKKDMNKAIRRFNELQRDFPESPFIPESYFFMAKAYIEDGNLNKAEEIVELILTKYPAMNKDQQVSLLMVEIAVRRHGNSQAILLLEKAWKSTKDETKRIDLILRLAELYIEMKQHSKAIALLENSHRKKDLPHQSYRMDLALLNCYIETGSLQKSLGFADLMLSKKLYEDHKDEILYKKGIILSQLGKYDEAILVFESITSKLDSSSILQDTSKVHAKALYELAILYQKKNADLESAKKYYSLASKAKDSLYAVISKKRLSAIGLLNRLRDGNDSLDGPPASRKLKIAEIFKYELDSPDSAYQYYIELGTDTSAEKEFVLKSLSAAAYIARDELKDTLLSDSLFNQLLVKFPATEFAKDAQKQLGLKVTVKTRQDSAYENFCRAEDLFYKNGNVKGAVQAFYNIYRDYPDLEIAPKSLFVAAWLSDDLLEKNKTAKMLYEKICEKYPESEYCTNLVQPKIQTVLDTLKILEARKAASEAKTQSSKSGPGAGNAQEAEDGDSLSLDKDQISPATITSDTTLVPDTTKSTEQ